MLQTQNRKKKKLYFPEGVSKALGKVIEYPFTIVEAPMGYGKTTAVREHLAQMDATLSWQNVYDDSVIAFWNSFCDRFHDIDDSCAESLRQLGFPNDRVTTQAALSLIENIVLPRHTIVVIDDFHLVNTQEITDFLMFLVINEVTNLHIVLVARFCKFISTEVLSLKGLLLHIKKEAFEFTHDEITNYYKLCGISLKENEDKELLAMTEGWISALYLIMLDFKQNGVLSTSINIHKLMEEAVYQSFSDKIKDFLLSMSIFPSFTQDLASYMVPDIEVETIINEVINRNSFVTYDDIDKTYHMHSIFISFLNGKLNRKGKTYTKILYGKAARWFLKCSDYIASMQFSFIAQDFDTLLEALEQDKLNSLNNEYKGLAIQYFNECPAEIKSRHPYSLLNFAMCFFTLNEMEAFLKACEEFMTIWKTIDNDDNEYKNRLLGEFEILMSFTKYNNIEKMSEHHKRACELLTSPSTMLSNRASWTFGSPSVLYMFYRESGALQKQVEIIREAMPYYYKVTSNHGMGAEEMMEAEYYYSIGDFENAEIYMHRVYQAAAGKSSITLCAISLNIKLALLKGDIQSIQGLFKRMHDEIYAKKWYMFIHTQDLCEAYMFSSLHQIDKVQPWIKEGKFEHTKLLFPSMGFLNVVYGRVMLENGEYLKLLGMSEQFMGVGSVFPNLMCHIYTCIYVAAANSKLNRAKEAIDALRQAFDIAMPDKIYMPFVENGEYIKDLLKELQTHNMYENDILKIFELYNQYKKAVDKIIKEYAPMNKPELTERENQIARLVVEGLSNKEIGKRLFITENTVKARLKSVFEKLNINSRALICQHLKL